jgi:UDP-glucose 4-epimerase
MGRIAITGVASFLGAGLLRRLVESVGPDGVVAVDIASPPAALGIKHRFLDLTEPASDQHLLDVLEEEGVGTVVHMAFFTNPQRDSAYAHELESIGTLSVMAASAAAGVKHVVVRSFTAVYGAHGQNPSFLTEDSSPRADSSLSWLRDKVEAEEHAASFARRYPEMTVSVLRFAPLFGPGVRTFYTRLFDKRVVPMLMGYDPLVQLLHPEDALGAAEVVLKRRIGGAFNVVPRASIRLASAIHLAAKVPVPVPHPVAYATSDLLWSAGLAEAPGAFLDYVRYPFVADGARAKERLGYEALHSSRDALMAYLRYRHPESAPETMEAQP